MKKLLTLQIIFFSVISIITLSSAQATVQKPSADYYEQVLQAYAYALSRLDFTLSDFCINQPDVQKRGDVFYLPNEEAGITATSICVYKYQDGLYASKGKLKNGKLDGKWTAWYENGQIKRETNYKDAKPDGKATEWYENGQIKTEHNYQLSKSYPVFVPNSKWTKWYENGQKEGEGCFKNGKKDGKWTKWDENGQITVQNNYKDGN